MFSKEEYRKNRDAGKRGQGEDFIATVTKTKGPSTRKRDRAKLVDRKKTKKGFQYGTKIGTRVFNSVKAAQRRFVNSEFADKIISSEVMMSKDKPGKDPKENVVKKYLFKPKTKHLRYDTEEQRRHRKNFPTPTQDPKITNKQRVQKSRADRKVK